MKNSENEKIMISTKSYITNMSSKISVNNTLVLSLVFAPVFLVLAGCGPTIEEVQREAEKAALSASEVSASTTEWQDGTSEHDATPVGKDGATEHENEQVVADVDTDDMDAINEQVADAAQHESTEIVEHSESVTVATDNLQVDIVTVTTASTKASHSSVGQQDLSETIDASTVKTIAEHALTDSMTLVDSEVVQNSDAQKDIVLAAEGSQESDAQMALAAENPNDTALRDELMAVKQAKEGADLALAAKMAEVRALERLLSDAEDKIAQMSNELEAVNSVQKTEQNALLQQKRIALIDKLQASREIREALSRQSGRTKEAVDRASEASEAFNTEIGEVSEKVSMLSETDQQ
jgi:hypothetical protein